MHDSIPAEALLDGYPDDMRVLAERLREIVKATIPESVERVRTGWRLIGYDLPIGRRSVFFCFVAPEPEHVHLGFERGVLLDDPDGLLLGRGITKLVRWLTFRPGDVIDPIVTATLIRDCARVAAMSRPERTALELDREMREGRSD
jgi:hypothetical protein